jgi:chemotaxis signal transduction protein
MSTMVCFRAAGTTYALPLYAARAVRTAHDLVALPDPAPDGVGIIPGDPPHTVISPLRAEAGHILVVETGDRAFGLLVDAVTGLERFDESQIKRAPEGQGRPLVAGTLEVDGRLVFVTDPDALGGRL